LKLIKHKKLALIELKYSSNDEQDLSEKDIQDMFNYSVSLEGIEIKCISVSDDSDILPK
tara:strand:- start:72 stop:248 length:177 start_codon:yes stop_codon:yes gene_type:complete